MPSSGTDDDIGLGIEAVFIVTACFPRISIRLFKSPVFMGIPLFKMQLRRTPNKKPAQHFKRPA
jgi:hypothetical protein